MTATSAGTAEVLFIDELQNAIGAQKGLSLDVPNSIGEYFLLEMGILDATEGCECCAERVAKDWQTHLSLSFLTTLRRNVRS